MDEAMAKTASLAAILAGVLMVAACDKGAESVPVNRIQGASYITPSGWKEILVDGAALLQAPDSIGMYAPSIIISMGGKPVTRQMAEKSYATYKSNPHNAMSVLSKTVVGGASGWTFTWKYTDKIARTLPRPKTADYPLDVEHTQTYIMLDVGGVTYHIHYKCPLALDVKFRPDFGRFMTSLKFDANRQ